MMKIRKYIKKNLELAIQVFIQIFFRGGVLFLIVRGIYLVLIEGKIDSTSLIFFVSSGVLNGINYGIHNHNFLHERNESPNYLHRSHIVWEHIFCGIVSSLTAYLLVIRLNSLSLTNLVLNGQDFVLMLFTLLGYCGFLPMILWFFAHSIQTIEAIIKKN